MFKARLSTNIQKKKPGQKLKSDATADHWYYINCKGIDKDIRVSHYMYYNDYEKGDGLFIVIDLRKGAPLLNLIYKTNEYEYVGERLTNSY